MKKAQAAMEDLMVYGWVILVILIVIAAFFYLGVFDAEVPNTCQIQAPFVCKDFVAKENGVIFSIGSRNIKEAEVNSIKVNGEDCIIEDGTLENNVVKIVRCAFVESIDTKKISADIQITYSSSTNLEHVVNGEGKGTLEDGLIEGISVIPVNETTVLYLQFDSNITGAPDWKNKTEDLSIYDNDAYCINMSLCPVFTQQGYVGGGFDYNGVQFLKVDNAEELQGMDQLTIAFWMYARDLPGYSNFVSKALSWQKYDYAMFTDCCDNMMLYFPNKKFSSVCELTLNQWTYFIITYDGSKENTTRIYLNGGLEPVFEDFVKGPVGSGNYDLKIGGTLEAFQIYNPNWYFNGTIDEVRIWNRVLGLEEIENLYNSYMDVYLPGLY